MSPELQELLDRIKPLADAVVTLRDAKVATLHYSDFAFFKNHRAQEYLIAQQKEIEAQIKAYFSPEVAA